MEVGDTGIEGVGAGLFLDVGAAEVALLPRTHGSALFTRGETQSLAVCTLGGESMAQRFEAAEGTPVDQWRADAKNYIGQLSGLKKLEWIDATYSVRWVEGSVTKFVSGDCHLSRRVRYAGYGNHQDRSEYA